MLPRFLKPYTAVLRLPCRELLRWTGDSSTHHYFLQNQSFRSITTSTNQPSLELNYLIKSCGLAPESALKVSQQIVLKNTTRSDSVLDLFRNYGFTETQISKIITKGPWILLADPHKTLKPKFEFFLEKGISGPNLSMMLSGATSILQISLVRQIIPSFNFLGAFLDTNDIALTLSRLSWCNALPKLMGPNIVTLQNHGVSDSSISKLLLLHPRLLTWKADKFQKVVLETKEMGFDPLSSMFIHGLRAISWAKKPIREAKLAVFRDFAWSEDEILTLLRKQPYVLSYKEKLIKTKLDFFINKLNWRIEDICRYPVLSLSFEKRIVPRCNVYSFLLTKGKVHEESLGTALKISEHEFFNKFVMRYQEELPEVLKMYQSKMGYVGSDVGCKEGSGNGD